MKKVMIQVMVLCGVVALEGAEARRISGSLTTPPPPGYDDSSLVKIHPSEGKGGAQVLSSSPGNSVLGGVCSAVASYFVSPPPVSESEDQRMARELRTAVIAKDARTLELLLEKESGVRCAQLCSKEDRLSAFHIACLNQYIEGIVIFHKHRVTVDTLNEEGNTALQVALGRGHIDVARKLVELRASVSYDELAIVRGYRQKHRSDEAIVKQMTELLAARKKKEAEEYVYDTDTESTSEAEEK